MFAVMIAIHEFGHFSAAKLFGIRVNQFAIGMGPVIWKKQGKETLYSLARNPDGGASARWRARTPQANERTLLRKAALVEAFYCRSSRRDSQYRLAS